MKSTKTLMLAALTVMSLGIGTAMAQESAGGYIAGPFEQRELLAQSHAYGDQVATALAAPGANAAPQYGSSDRASTTNWTVLEGGDGTGG
jgi:hypothetical protein